MADARLGDRTMDSNTEVFATNVDENPSPPAYLNKQQLSARSGVSASTIQRYKDEKRIPFYQPGGKGGRLFFPLNAIEAAAQQAQDEQRHTAGVRQITASITPSRLAGPRPRWQTNTCTT